MKKKTKKKVHCTLCKKELKKTSTYYHNGLTMCFSCMYNANEDAPNYELCNGDSD